MVNKLEYLLKELDAARAELWSALDAIDADHLVNSQWNKRDFYAHIAGWEAAVFKTLRQHVQGTPESAPPYSDLDTANACFVASRQSLTTEDAKLECEINRFAIKKLLEKLLRQNRLQLVQFPWGDETIEQFLQGAINHERDHADEIIRLTRNHQR